MRKEFIIALILILLSCHNPNPYESLNNPPHTPTVVFPTNDTTEVSINLDLQWNGGDPDADDVVNYDIYLEANNSNPKLIASNVNVNTYRPNTLQYSTKYYWKIVSKDRQGEQTTGSIWSFRTQQEHNRQPYTPNNPTPKSGSVDLDINNVILQWESGDPDTYNIVSYDIYFGTTKPLTKIIASIQQNTSYSLSLLEYNTQYFWQIKAKDNYGLESTGPVWNFTTKSATSYFTESFDNYIVGVPPADSNWVVYGDYGTVFITDNEFYGSSGQSCQFVDLVKDSSSILAAKRFSPTPKSVGVLEFAWMVESNNDFLGMRLYSENIDIGPGPQISIRGDSLQYYDHNWSWKLITNIVPATWYKVRLVFDCVNQNYNIYVNDELKISDVGWNNADISSIKYLYFLTFDDRTCSGGYVDEIRYYSGEVLGN